jgi:hypothetical protein
MAKSQNRAGYQKWLWGMFLCCMAWQVQGVTEFEDPQQKEIVFTPVASEYLGCAGEYIVKVDKKNRIKEKTVLEKLPVVGFVCRDDPSILYLGLNGDTVAMKASTPSYGMYPLVEIGYHSFLGQNDSGVSFQFFIETMKIFKKDFDVDNQCLDLVKLLYGTIYKKELESKQKRADFSNLMTYTKCPSRGK